MHSAASRLSPYTLCCLRRVFAPQRGGHWITRHVCILQRPGFHGAWRRKFCPCPPFTPPGPFRPRSRPFFRSFPQRYQTSRRAICVRRGRLAWLKIFPKFVLVGFSSGGLNEGWFKKLKNSARNCRVTFSVILVSLS